MRTRLHALGTRRGPSVVARQFGSESNRFLVCFDGGDVPGWHAGSAVEFELREWRASERSVRWLCVVRNFVSEVRFENDKNVGLGLVGSTNFL